MATKNLARTIIEGGRDRSNKWDRKHSHRQERALTREFLSKARARDDGFDGLATPRRPKVYKSFADKLGAPRRWLARQVGRPWDHVHAEMFTRFDPRTLAGRHIIFDHLLQEVRIHPVDRRRFWVRPELYVDRHGILRERAGIKRTPWRSSELPESVRAWANGRRVAAEGQALFWQGACRATTR